MPRKARQKEESGIYHVMLRGIDRQLIFEDTEFALSVIDRSEFVRFNNTPNSDTCMELVTPSRHAVTDTQAQVVIEKISHCKTITEFRELEEKKKERFVKKIYDAGVSIRQLSRLTGTTKGMVEKYLKA